MFQKVLEVMQGNAASELDSWELHTLPDNDEFVPDNSNVYVLVNLDKMANMIRVDVMSNDDIPITSYRAPTARALYKLLALYGEYLSSDHMAYIGYELGRAEVSLQQGLDYVQS